MIFTRREKKKTCITLCFGAVSDAMETRKQHNDGLSWQILMMHETPSDAIKKAYLLYRGLEHEKVLRLVPADMTSKQLPAYMDDVAEAIYSKAMGYSFFSEALTNHIGDLATRYEYEELWQLHSSHESFMDDCINYVISLYSNHSIELFDTVDHSLDQSKVKQTPWQNCCDRFVRCKEKAKEKCIKRCRDEKYLGKITFSDELRRSFDEFILIVKHDFGFLPYYCHE
jgi:hypothetical protein